MCSPLRPISCPVHQFALPGNLLRQFVDERLALLVHFQPAFSFRVKPSNFGQELMAQVLFEQVKYPGEDLRRVFFPVFFQYPDAAVQLKLRAAAKDKRILVKPVIGDQNGVIYEFGFFTQFQGKVPVFKNLQLRVKTAYLKEKVSGNDRGVKWNIILPQKSDRVKFSSKKAIGFPF